MSNPSLPPGWRETELGQLGSLFRGRGGTRADEDINGLPCIRYGDLYTHHDCVVRSFASAISRTRASAYSRLQKGDVVFAGSGETFAEIGKAAAYCDESPAYAGGDTIIFRPGSELIPEFAGYAVNGHYANAHKARMGQGSSVIHIGSEHLARMPFRLPPTVQQQRIAEILSIVDEAIEQTEALIAKTQQIKAGLMHDLFTRGVTPDGHLRPPREQAPQFYKQSPLGWIPKEWMHSRMIDLYKEPIRDFGSFSSTNLITFLDEGIPFIKSEMIGVGEIFWEDVTYISRDVHRQLNKSHVRAGDILFSKIGSALGKAVVYDGCRGICNSNAAVAKISMDNARARAQFVSYFLNLPTTKSQFRRLIISLLPRINLGDISALRLAVPPIDEQIVIEQRLLALDAQLSAETIAVDNYRSIRKGLMQDLLTGRVPVPVA